MNRNKLRKLRREVVGLRNKQAKSSDLQGLAKRLELKQVNRGKEPTFASDVLVNVRPLSIPGHKGRDLPHGTKTNILNLLDDILDAWDEILTEQERANAPGRKNGND